MQPFFICKKADRWFLFLKKYKFMLYYPNVDF